MKQIRTTRWLAHIIIAVLDRYTRNRQTLRRFELIIIHITFTLWQTDPRIQSSQVSATTRLSLPQGLIV